MNGAADISKALGGRSSGAIRSGDWKLIEFFDDQTVELYNLAHDIEQLLSNLLIQYIHYFNLTLSH